VLRFIFKSFVLLLVFFLVACKGQEIDGQKDIDTDDKLNLPVKIFLSEDISLSKDIINEITSALQKQCPNITFEKSDNSLRNHLRIQLATHDLDVKSTKYLDELAQKSTLNRMVIFVFSNYDLAEQTRWEKLLAKYGPQLKLAGLSGNISKEVVTKNIISRLGICEL